MPADYIPQTTRERVAAAAHYCCEYCQTAQEISGAQMHVEHVIPLNQKQPGRTNRITECCIMTWR